VRAWYGLKESGKMAHDDIVAHMAKHGYKEARTPGLFLHTTRPIRFTLVVDDFGIKYTDKNDVEQLKTSLEEIYTMKIDWEGKRYVGIDLKWDYKKRKVLCSMDGYVEAALKEFAYNPQTSPQWPIQSGATRLQSQNPVCPGRPHQTTHARRNHLHKISHRKVSILRQSN
jgi:hypothetical protein